MSAPPAAARQRHYTSAYGRVVEIESETPELLLPFLPDGWSDRPPTEEIDRRYLVEQTRDGRWSLTIDGAAPSTQSDLAPIAVQIEGDLHHWLATYTRGYLFVHAGCVGWNDRAIVLPGRSHAGKTTLTRALLEAGAVYFSDDYAVIAPNGDIYAFPRRLQVRPEPPGPTIYLDPVARNWDIGSGPIRAALVADLKFDRDRGWEIESLARGAGALALLDNTVAARERPQDALRVMSNVMASATAIRGTRDEADAAAQRLLAIVDRLV